jgi:outer membrane protein OmpA-like peptidoglycan-associated protein
VVEAIAKVLANNVPVLNGTPIVPPIQFNPDSAKLDSTDLAAIKKAASVLEGKSGVLLITGFVKYTGVSSAKAKALAQARAKNVATALAKLGVRVKLGYVGYGPRNTANPTNTDRKVELRWVPAPVSNP